MQYQVFQPSPTLQGIRCIWMLSDDARPDAAPQRVVPDGCVELVLNVGDRFRHLPDGGAPSLQPAALVVGDARRPMVIAPTGRVDIIGIRFEPGGAPQFLGAPMRELIDRSFDLADVRPALYRRLLDRIGETPGAADRLRVIEHSLSRSVSRKLMPDPRLARAARLVTETRGRAGLDAITQSLGVGNRWLQRRFRESVGFGPKLLGRLTRFHSLVAALDGSRPTRWARAAAEHGYYDQSHLIRDFRTFAGTSPAAYLREPSALNALFARSS